RLLPPSIFPSPHISTSSTRNPKNYRAGGRLFSLLTTIEEANGQPYTIQVAQDRSTDDRFTKEFGALVAVVLAFGILASTLNANASPESWIICFSLRGSMQHANQSRRRDSMRARRWKKSRRFIK